MNFKSRVITAIATGAVLVSALAPLASADTIAVTGNGALSGSVVNVTNSSNTVVNQTNNANISNNINTSASTGNNSSNFNTGGNSTISTGNASTNVTVNNAANLNQATVSCGCDNSGTDVNVTGNGAESENGVNVNNANQVFLNQNNDANYKNNVTANATTGSNDSSYNTGGSTVVVTGNASTNVQVNNAANANVANVGGSDGSSDPSSVVVAGNGALSATGVNLDNESAVVLDQANNAQIDNNIKANAKTGDNESQFNTGGNNGIESGNATDNVGINNFANFNEAAVSCDCTLSDLGVNVAGNGAESENGVNASTSNSVFPNQINDEGLWNGVTGGSKTGDNTLGFSTGSVWGGDPVVISGDGTSSTNVNNVGNANVLNGDSVSLPGGVDLGMNFDLNGLWAFFNGLSV